jgi:hypothetical protein
MLTSCLVGTRVSIINKAKDDKSITVHYPANFRFPITLRGENQDSLPGYDISKTENSITSHDYYKYPAKVHITTLDTMSRTFSFNLKKGYELILQDTYPTVTPAFGLLFIIDYTDTVKFDRSGAFFKKHPKMGKGGRWIYRIIDDNRNTHLP